MANRLNLDLSTVQVINLVQSGLRPAPTVYISSSSILARFTSDERTAIYTSSMTNGAVSGELKLLELTPAFLLSDPKLKGILDSFVTAGALTQDRENEILSTAPTGNEVYQG